MRGLLPIVLLLIVSSGVACASGEGDREASYSCSYREFGAAAPPEMLDPESRLYSGRDLMLPTIQRPKYVPIVLAEARPLAASK